jgi:replicative DNA helicase
MDEPIIKKIPPHSDEAEAMVIGSMLLDPEAVTTVMEILKQEDFYQKKYSLLFEAISQLYDENKPVDVMILREKLKQNNAPDDVCDFGFLTSLTDSVPTTANVGHYAKIVANKAAFRRLIRTSEEIADACYTGREEPDALLSGAEKRIFDISQGRTANDYVPIEKVVMESLKGIQAASRSNSGVTGIATGFYDLDAKTAGLQPSDLIIVAARPSMGKTAFVLNIAEFTAVRSNVATLVFSLEMSKTQMVNRILAMHSSVDAQSLNTGRLNPTDWTKLVESARVISKSPIIIDDTAGISINALRSKCRRYKIEHNVGLIIIDYLQLMTVDKKVDSRQQEIMEISRALKALARELNCPIIACSQLSRLVEQRPDKRPMLSDLRESGAIEQDADVVMFLYRDEYYNKDSDKKGIAEVIIGKQRRGPIGTVELVSQLEYTRFRNKQH